VSDSMKQLQRQVMKGALIHFKSQPNILIIMVNQLRYDRCLSRPLAKGYSVICLDGRIHEFIFKCEYKG
jgi:hypothetical protein